MSTPQGILPVLAVRNTVIFPGLTQLIKVGREKSVNALKEAQNNGFWIVASQQKKKEDDSSDFHLADANPQEVYNVGTLCRIDSIKGNDQTGYQVILRGITRVQLNDIQLSEKKYLQADVIHLEDMQDINEATQNALLQSVKDISKEILSVVPGNTEPMVELLNSVQDLSFLIYLCIGNLDLDLKTKQQVLDTSSLKERALLALAILQDFRDGMVLQNEIRSKLNQRLGQTQRQHILREQLKTIRQELGEDEAMTVEEKLRAKIDEAGMPEDVKKVADQELKKLLESGNQSPETHIIRNYLELLVALPWSKSSQDKDWNLDEARQILDADHFGLDKIKKRIVQHLALMKLKGLKKGSILLLVGPPGVGKTSLAQSIAKTLGRKYARVSLGGVRDDAEIRGHRRTYIGAMPGRIIQALKRAGENNPVFLLDEVDKMSRAFQGDPAAAMLEVLDPEQNNTFLDHYLDVAFDLSKVFFIATANSLDGIPGPLLDRMEIIDVSGYTSQEKMEIAKRHLIPKQLTEAGMTDKNIMFSDESISELIQRYTREAGVRELQRVIAAVLRAASERVLKNPDQLIEIKTSDFDELLGPQKYFYEMASKNPTPGVVTGLAWTPVGGDILFIESQKMIGKGELILTGQLGDVMKESARIALSIVRASLGPLASPWAGDFDPTKHDIHLHVPAGAIPKDGPSAGVAILTSLASLIYGKAVNNQIAMTGEISLSGQVMPVGGIKEKVIAAHRAGIKEVILPEKNKKDLKDIPQNVQNDLKIHFVSNVSDVLEITLGLTATLLNFPSKVSAADSLRAN